MNINNKNHKQPKQNGIWPADKPLTGIKAIIEDKDYERLIPKERFTSPEWLDKEYKLLWPRVWQWACREEEIPKVGDYLEYKIGDQSVVIVRDEDESLKAYHNVCMHRGTRLVEGCLLYTSDAADE